jgi:hypothetical protein
MATTERGQYRFSVKETTIGTFFLAAERAGDGLYGLLGFNPKRAPLSRKP